MASIAQIYDWFMTGKKPTQAQFWAAWGSSWNKEESIPQSAISNLTTVLNAKTENDQFNAHKVAGDAHADLFLSKEDKTQKGVAGGYVPLDAFSKIAHQFLSIVNNLTDGTANDLLSGEQGVVLQTQITAINTLLTSNDVNLDTVQEIVDAIKTVETSLSSILVNDLTTGGTTKALTAEMGKTLKGLIDALTTTVANLSFSIITTITPILAYDLFIGSGLGATHSWQASLGMVNYINALSPAIVVANNEVVKFRTTDTGRVYELKLRGRSFGVGQPPIIEDDILDMQEFLNKDILLSNYKNSRNDGQIPNNRVLSTDSGGRLKLFSIATSPAPYINELVPDSYLPDTTGNIRIHGDFFTPAMCDRVANPNSIIIGGITTIHYATFVSSQELLVNVTTGSVEGSFPCTLNNGLSTTKNNALLIVLGTVYKPTNLDWNTLTGSPLDFGTGDKAATTIYNNESGANWTKEFNYNINFRVSFIFTKTPLGNTVGSYSLPMVNLQRVSDGINQFSFLYRNEGSWNARILHNSLQLGGDFKPVKYSNSSISLDDAFSVIEGIKTEFRYINGIMYAYYNNALVYQYPDIITSNFKLNINLKNVDITDIKYIETA